MLQPTGKVLTLSTFHTVRAKRNWSKPNHKKKRPLPPCAPINVSIVLFHPLKSIVEPLSGKRNPLTKKKGVPYTPLEVEYCITKDISNYGNHRNDIY